MNRTHLECAAEALASAHGYTLFAAHDRSTSPAPNRYPAAILAPLTLHSTEGRKHGRTTYCMELSLLCAATKMPPKERRKRLAAMEVDMLAIFSELTEDTRVIAVEKLTVEPGAGLTPHGALSQTGSCLIITRF